MDEAYVSGSRVVLSLKRYLPGAKCRIGEARSSEGTEMPEYSDSPTGLVVGTAGKESGVTCRVAIVRAQLVQSVAVTDPDVVEAAIPQNPPTSSRVRAGI